MTTFASTIINQECLQLVTDEYTKLQDAVEDLGISVSNTLAEQKKDLDLTHNAQVRKLQLEIESLNKDKARLEESIATNERACQLETEREWYKKEALALDDELQKLKTKHKEMETKLDESEADRVWLRGQVEMLTRKLKKEDEKDTAAAEYLTTEDADKETEAEGSDPLDDSAAEFVTESPVEAEKEVNEE